MIASATEPMDGRHCCCREGITHWLTGADRCRHCHGDLTGGPWSGEELVFGGEAGAPPPADELDLVVLAD